MLFGNIQALILHHALILPSSYVLSSHNKYQYPSELVASTLVLGSSVGVRWRDRIRVAPARCNPSKLDFELTLCA
jgi:hypothetical protein